MNLRRLKKLSKRAAAYLVPLGDHRQQFRARRMDECCTGLRIWDSRGERNSWDTHPLPGTPMIGGMSGYYEPEWDEETAWEALCNLVIYQFTDVVEREDGLHMVSTRKLRTASQVFAAADDLLRPPPALPREGDAE